MNLTNVNLSAATALQRTPNQTEYYNNKKEKYKKNEIHWSHRRATAETLDIRRKGKTLSIRMHSKLKNIMKEGRCYEVGRQINNFDRCYEKE